MRSFDATRLNQIANLSHVRKNLGGSAEVLDLSPLVLNPANFTFENDLGGFVCVNTFGSTFEVHSIFNARKPEQAADIENLMFRAENYMFTRTKCLELTSRVPDGNRWAAALANKFAFQDVVRQKNWDAGRAAQIKRKTLEDWARGAPETFMAGRNFHETLEAAKKRFGSKAAIHEDDSTHDAIVGGTVLMCKGGQIGKGLSFYNYWAALAGYQPVNLVSDAPLVIDMGEAVIGLEDGQVEVLLCR